MTSPSSKGAVLVVFPFCADHVGHGNIQRILAIARYLAAGGYDVDLVYQGNPRLPEVTAQYAMCRQIFRVESGSRSGDEVSWGRKVAEFYCGHETPARTLQPSVQLSTLVRSLVEAQPYRVVLSTYAFTAPMFAGLGRKILTICDVQDILHEHAAACRQVTGQSSSFSLPAATEAFLWRQWDVLVAITPEDADRISQDVLPRQHVLCARHATTRIAESPAPGTDDVALYAGSDNGSNIQSVTWLLDEVWPRVIAMRPSARLRIAGLICRALSETVRRIPGVEIVGFQPDLSEEFVSCGVLVAPYLYGSGLKIKVVEAACAGKAIVTTSGGATGSGLDAGSALEIHDDAKAFADALSGLLGSSARRESLAVAALAQAAALYAPEACYSPIAQAIELMSTKPASTEAGHGVPATVIERITLVVEQLAGSRIIIWGNGSHTRSLLAALAATSVAVSIVADKSAGEPGTTPEGIPVMPPAQLVLGSGDLVILSSETFEEAMWQDLAAFRRDGGHVLALHDLTLVSDGLLTLLSIPMRTRLGLGSPSRVTRTQATHLLWDSRATAARWWRLCSLSDLATAATNRGEKPLIITHASLAGAEAALDDLAHAAPVAPIIELDGRVLELADLEGGHTGLAKLSALTARTAARTLASLSVGSADTLTLVSPTLAECFALSRALQHLADGAPAVVLHGLPNAADELRWLRLGDSDRQAYWRLAVSALAVAAHGRLSILASDASEATTLQSLLDRPIVSGQDVARAGRSNRTARTASVVCLGHAAEPGVRPRLESIVGSRQDAVQWRSNQSDGRRGADDRWASGLASVLGITLLDELPASSMRNAITSASAVIVLSDSPREGWREAAAAYASDAGVPFFMPHHSLDTDLRRLLNESTC